jgi:hypothetical protein
MSIHLQSRQAASLTFNGDQDSPLLIQKKSANYPVTYVKGYQSGNLTKMPPDLITSFVAHMRRRCGKAGLRANDHIFIPDFHRCVS